MVNGSLISPKLQECKQEFSNLKFMTPIQYVTMICISLAVSSVTCNKFINSI